MAPQAPYFSSTHYKNGAMLTVHAAVGDQIDWYNIQFYNQGSAVVTIVVCPSFAARLFVFGHPRACGGHTLLPSHVF